MAITPRPSNCRTVAGSSTFGGWRTSKNTTRRKTMKSRKAQKDLLDTVSYDGIDYPALQARGNAAKFAKPLFDEIIPPGSRGYDVGFGRPEWAIRADATLVGDGEEFHALNLPAMDPMADYLFSSHCLEH